MADPEHAHNREAAAAVSALGLELGRTTRAARRRAVLLAAESDALISVSREIRLEIEARRLAPG